MIVSGKQMSSCRVSGHYIYNRMNKYTSIVSLLVIIIFPLLFFRIIFECKGLIFMKYIVVFK